MNNNNEINTKPGYQIVWHILGATREWNGGIYACPDTARTTSDSLGGNAIMLSSGAVIEIAETAVYSVKPVSVPIDYEFAA